jgi:hypothetical protein
MNFEFRLGNDVDYIHYKTRDPLRGGSAHNTSFPLPMRLEALVNSRIQKLRLGEDDIRKAERDNKLIL